MGRKVQVWALAAAVAALSAMSFLTAATLGEAPPDVRLYVAAMILGGVGVLAGLAKTDHLSARTVLLVALALHLVALAGAPRFEDDYFRFLWDGWRTLSSGSPYGVPPEAFFGARDLPDQMQTVLDGVNNPEVPTIYGPVLELLFAASVALFGPEERALRGLLGLVNLGLIALMLRGAPARQVALYAWCPLVVTEIVLHAHPDGVMAALLIAGLYAGRAQRRLLAGALFGAAAAAKIVALALWPALLRLGPRAAIAALLGCGALYLPFVLQTPEAGLDGTATFAERWRFNAMFYEVVSWAAPSDTLARLACAVAGVGLVLWSHARDSSFAELGGHRMFGYILLFSPVINAWYLLWLLPFAIGRREIWPWAASVALPLSYLTGVNLDDPGIAAFELHPAAKALEILIVLAAVVYDLRRSMAKKKPSQPLRAGVS